MPLSSLVRQRESRSSRPFVAALVTAATSIALLALAIRYGWLGVDVGRGGQFCEATWSPIKQRANTLSNLGFVVAGLLVGARASRPAGLGDSTLARHAMLATAFACLVVLLGPASAAMHATGTSLGGRLDVLSMHLVASFALAYALMRTFDRGPGFMGGAFFVILAVSQLAGQIPVRVPFAMTPGNLTFGLALVAAVVLEVRLSRTRLRLDQRWGVLATACMLVALAVWQPSQTGGPLCNPDSLVQGHAAWHLLGAAAAWCLFQLYASERPRVHDRT